MDDVSVGDVRRICARVTAEDLTHITARPVNRLDWLEMKSVVDKMSVDGLQKIFGPRMSKQMIGQILGFAYKNDRKFFEFVFGVLKAMVLDPQPRADVTNVAPQSEIRIKGPYRVASGCSQRDFEPCVLSYGRNAFTVDVERGERRFFALFGKGASAVSEFSIGDATIIPGRELGVSAMVDVSEFLRDGRNDVRVCVSEEELFVVLPLEHLSEDEMVCAVLNNRPYLRGGVCSGEDVLVPVRGVRCQHREVFDLLPYVRECEMSQRWCCPVCGSDLAFADLGLDYTVYCDMRQRLCADSCE